MDSKALYNFTYGLFILGVKNNEKLNACVINTCIQVASNPIRVVFSVLNTNYTCDLLKKSETVSLSCLDKSCSFETVKRFGLQSGRDTDKFENFSYEIDDNGNPYLSSQVCSVFSAKILSSQDLGTHTLFIAELTDGKLTSSNAPLTYADYHKDLKPKTEIKSEKKIIGWRCKICGFEVEGETLPDDYICPLCSHPKEDFEPIYES